MEVVKLKVLPTLIPSKFLTQALVVVATSISFHHTGEITTGEITTEVNMKEVKHLTPSRKNTKKCSTRLKRLAKINPISFRNLRLNSLKEMKKFTILKRNFMQLEETINTTLKRSNYLSMRLVNLIQMTRPT